MKVNYISNGFTKKLVKKVKIKSRDFFYLKDITKLLDDNIELKNDHTLVLNSSNTYIVKFELKMKCLSNEDAFIGIINNNKLIESYMEENASPKSNRSINISLSTIIVSPFNSNSYLQFINLGGDILIQSCNIIVERII